MDYLRSVIASMEEGEFLSSVNLRIHTNIFLSVPPINVFYILQTAVYALSLRPCEDSLGIYLRSFIGSGLSLHQRIVIHPLPGQHLDEVSI